MLITPEYLELNRTLHTQRPDYGTSGKRWATCVNELLQATGSVSVLDYGCGKGTLKRSLPDVDVREYDPAIAGKDAAPAPADLVVCTDVLEHIEPECIDAVLGDIMGLAGKSALLAICCIESINPGGGKRLPDGRPAHILVRPPEWWAEKLSKYGEFRQIEGEAYEFNVVMQVAPAQG